MNEDSLEIFCSYLTSANKQGDIGEVITAYELRKLGFIVLRNLYFPYNGHLTEVDMIGLSPFGVFIIENKNYNGVVSGDLDDKYWYVEYKCCDKVKLLNPVIQNSIHKNSFLKLSCIPSDLNIRYVFNTVIFNDKCQLNLTNTNKNVFHLSDFIDIYTSFSKNRDELISKDILNYLYDNLNYYSDCSDFMRLLHVFTLKENKSGKEHFT